MSPLGVDARDQYRQSLVPLLSDVSHAIPKVIFSI
jgi:hypothetical protein